MGGSLVYDPKYTPYAHGEDGKGENALEFWSRNIPETAVDEIIKILELDPDETGKSGWALKYELWSELSFVIWGSGQPTPKVLRTEPGDLRDYAADLQSKLHDALYMLKSMEYEAVYQTVEKAGAKTKGLIVSNEIRSKSKAIAKGVAGFADGFASHHHALHGEWPKLYNFDSELPAAIEALEKILPYFDAVVVDTAKAVPEKKKGRDKAGHDILIFRLCGFYKNYTGITPNPNSKGDRVSDPGGVTHGPFIKIVQAVLPHTEYKNDTTDIAIMKRVKNLKKNVKYKGFWVEQKE